MLFAGYLARRIIFSSPEERTNYLYINVLLCVRTTARMRLSAASRPMFLFIFAPARASKDREKSVLNLYLNLYKKKKGREKKEREKNEEETSTLVGITSREKYVSMKFPKNVADNGITCGRAHNRAHNNNNNNNNNR